MKKLTVLPTLLALLALVGCKGITNLFNTSSNNNTTNWGMLIDGDWVAFTQDSTKFVNYSLYITGTVIVGSANYPVFDGNGNITSYDPCPVTVRGSTSGTAPNGTIPTNATVTLSDCFTSAMHTVAFQAGMLGNSTQAWYGVQAPYSWSSPSVAMTADGTCGSTWNLNVTYYVPTSTNAVDGYTLTLTGGTPTATVTMTLTSGNCSLQLALTGPMKGGSFASTDGTTTIQEIPKVPADGHAHYQFLIKPAANNFGVTQLAGSD